MADTALQVVVSPFLGVFFDKLCSLIQTEFALIRGVKKEMKKLLRTLSTIKDVLEDAEKKQITNKTIQNWLSELKDPVYDADDVLDECAFEGLQLALEMRKNSFTKQVSDSFKQIKFRHKIAGRIKEVRERFDEIAEERSKFHLTEGREERSAELFQYRETTSMLIEPQVYGRDEDREYLVRLLLNNVNRPEIISVCPLLGIGGLGKTTLAQLVFNDARVTQGFEVKLWIYVSDDFDVKRLMKAIIVSLTGNGCGVEELEPLQRRLQEELSGKRFLFVLDDVWNENQDDWNKLVFSLRCGAKGSSVVVTTRLKTVAAITGTFPPYWLKVLSEDDCWSLFKQHAFGPGNEELPNLVEIGKEIVKKCGGVPLAAKALGGSLRFNTEEKKWSSLRDSEIWDIPESRENNILPALRLSYNHLPPHLRQCFTYCSIFPKDHVIEKEDLILLWMANGFLQSNEKMELEDVGNEIFNALVWRSFFQDVKKDADGVITTCKMHDLVHDLASHIAKDECYVMKTENITRRTRHLSISLGKINSSFTLESVASSSPGLRSLICLRTYIPVESSDFKFSSLIRVRALDLRYGKYAEIPNSIGNMKHLRYLNLSSSPITSLPESICGLSNVQTLKLQGCHKLETLPKGMRKMCSLRHLDIRRCFQLATTPIHIGKLTCLRTLNIFIASGEVGRGIKELQGLDLGGDLEIRGLEHVKNSLEAKEANLMRKQNLRELRLSWLDSHLQENATDVIEGLQPHSNLRRLHFKQYEGGRLPSWLAVSSLPNLVDVALFGCRRCEQLPPFKKLPLLKSLCITGMDSLRFIDDEVYGGASVVTGFPSLRELTLSSMPNLEGWISSQEPEGALVLPCLKRMSLRDCSKLRRVPLSLSLEKLQLKNCNEMVLGLLQSLPCLDYLEILEFKEVSCFPDGMLQDLTALQDLVIRSCDNLKSLPRELECLPSLTRLFIQECKNVISLPEGLRNLSSLRTLRILNCDSLKRLPALGASSLDNLQLNDCRDLELSTEDLQQLVHLRFLLLKGLPKLEFSTVGFQQLINLETLTLIDLPKLTCFPEGIKYIVTLRYLSIRGCCSNQMELPDWVGSLLSLRILEIDGSKNQKVLPEGFQHLTLLKDLKIRGCNPELERRCEKDKGEDWYKISHVGSVTINGREWHGDSHRDVWENYLF